MKQIEYTVLNLSEVAEKIKKGPEGTNLISVMNDYGTQGWEVVVRLNDSSFLMKRPKTDEVIPTVNKWYVPRGFKLVKED